jgi:hypothetical protein
MKLGDSGSVGYRDWQHADWGERSVESCRAPKHLDEYGIGFERQNMSGRSCSRSSGEAEEAHIRANVPHYVARLDYLRGEV